jgi:hypothetical protein
MKAGIFAWNGSPMLRRTPSAKSIMSASPPDAVICPGFGLESFT